MHGEAITQLMFDYFTCTQLKFIAEQPDSMSCSGQRIRNSGSPDGALDHRALTSDERDLVLQLAGATVVIVTIVGRRVHLGLLHAKRTPHCDRQAHNTFAA